MKPGSIAEWARRRLERLRATELYRRYLRPAVSVLRWEGIILLGALGFAIVSALVTRWFILFVFLAAVLLGLAWGRAFDESEKGQRFRRRAERAGLWVWALLLALVGVAIFWRVSTRLGSVIFALTFFADAVGDVFGADCPEGQWTKMHYAFVDEGDKKEAQATDEKGNGDGVVCVKNTANVGKPLPGEGNQGNNANVKDNNS
ncbi:MAG: hypothetical protein IH921_14025 [Gemmatimonadetes bacterium]|nr:hypothetical protein [Gemmatimonadota bacterium]